MKYNILFYPPKRYCVVPAVNRYIGVKFEHLEKSNSFDEFDDSYIFPHFAAFLPIS